MVLKLSKMALNGPKSSKCSKMVEHCEKWNYSFVFQMGPAQPGALV